MGASCVEMCGVGGEKEGRRVSLGYEDLMKSINTNSRYVYNFANALGYRNAETEMDQLIMNE